MQKLQPFIYTYIYIDPCTTHATPSHFLCNVWQTFDTCQFCVFDNARSNCEPLVSERLRRIYRVPDLLPADSERSALEWFFVGNRGKGAHLHVGLLYTGPKRSKWSRLLFEGFLFCYASQWNLLRYK